MVTGPTLLSNIRGRSPTDSLQSRPLIRAYLGQLGGSIILVENAQVLGRPPYIDVFCTHRRTSHKKGSLIVAYNVRPSVWHQGYA